MQIIPATISDMQAVYRLICQLEEQTLCPADFERIYLQNLQNPAICYLLCKDGGEVLGFCSLHMQSLLHHAGKIAEELGPQGFHMIQNGKVESDRPSIFANETTAYAVIYD
ncbi:MAG: hypothetical protein KH334_07655, partial [Clostridiales bacterium]|nr:hypothetical protein [Clostridiales bacterium]